jgi:phosphatidylserine/phosphatidylglycerophosphate/cardiolipin synthase-like enzyme
MSDGLPSRWKNVLGKAARPGNSVTFLIDGPRTFAAMHAAIITARGPGHYIYLLGWSMDLDVTLVPGKDDTTFLALAKAAAAGGVQIRVMLWDQVGTTNSSQITALNQVENCVAILDNHTLIVGAHHQKVLIVRGGRGLTAFCGGIDIFKNRVQTVPGEPWSPYHDVHCQIVGPAASDLANVFVQRWRENPDTARFDKPPQGEALAGEKDAFTNTTGGDSAASYGPQVVRIGRTLNRPGGFSSCAIEHSVDSLMTAAIGAARRFIYIEDQYLVLEKAARLMQRQLEKLQGIVIVIPHHAITDFPGVVNARATFLKILSPQPSKKVRVLYRYTPGKVKFGAHSYVHSKTWIFDDELAVIGSANCNNRGWNHDSEVVALIADGPADAKAPSFPQQLRSALWAEHLGLDSPVKVQDAVASLSLWDAGNLPQTAGVLPYDPLDHVPSRIGRFAEWAAGGGATDADPDASGLARCPDALNVR